MAAAIGFDVYGTLVDPLGIGAELRRFVGDDAERVAQLWRTTQLEYTWRRSLMGLYQPFSVCTAQALDFAARSLGHELAPDSIAALIEIYRRLPAFPEAAAGLEHVRRSGHRTAAFSNGEEPFVRAVLSNAGLLPMLEGVISVDEVKLYKPAPSVYRYLAARMGTDLAATWLVSSNPFDVIGAKAAGLCAAWVRRNPRAIFDPWGAEPDIVVADLIELSERLGVAPFATSIKPADRIVLRRWAAADADSLTRLADNRNISINLRDRFPYPYTRADADSWIAHCRTETGKPTQFAIDVEGVAIGGIGIEMLGDVHRVTAEIGYWIGEPYWGRGIATAAVIEMTRYAFAEFPVERLQALVFEWNPASRRVLEKAGYSLEAPIARCIIKEGRIGNAFMYACLRR